MVESRPKRGSSKPGEAYYYNNWDFNTLGAIFEKMTGKSIFTAFYEDVAQPIGMLQYKGLYDSINTSNPNVEIPETDGYYQYEPSKSKYPAYHFRMSTYDLGLYGMLYANKGKWKGKQIVPEKWIEYSTEPLSIVNEEYGIARGILWGVNLKYACFEHSGYGGQLLRIYPNSKLVFVHRVNDEDGEILFQEDNIYPIFGILFGAKID